MPMNLANLCPDAHVCEYIKHLCFKEQTSYSTNSTRLPSMGRHAGPYEPVHASGARLSATG